MKRRENHHPLVAIAPARVIDQVAMIQDVAQNQVASRDSSRGPETWRRSQTLEMIQRRNTRSEVRTICVLGVTALLGCGGGTGDPFSVGSPCDGYVVCCSAFPEVQRTACLSAAERLRAQPGSDSVCAEQLRQWEASGACQPSSVDASFDSQTGRRDAGVADGGVADGGVAEAGPVVVVDGYTLQAISLARRSRTTRDVLDVTLRLGVDAASASAPMVSSLFRVIGDDGLERVGITGAASQCPASALVAPGASVTCAVAFEVPPAVRVLRLVYQTPVATRLETSAPAESALPQPPLIIYLERESASCSATGCGGCVEASQILCGLATPGQCATLVDQLLECENAPRSCNAFLQWESCMRQREGGTHARCAHQFPVACTEHVENTQSLCSDSRDNDADNFIDCDDRDCCSVVNVSSCSATTFCGRQSCPEHPDVVVAYRSCSHEAYNALMSCLSAAQTDPAVSACFAAAPSACAECVGYSRAACVTAGTTGACNREWNCFLTCLEAACPTGDDACEISATNGACSVQTMAWSTCRNAPPSAACRTAYTMCEVTP